MNVTKSTKVYFLTLEEDIINIIKQCDNEHKTLALSANEYKSLRHSIKNVKMEEYI